MNWDGSDRGRDDVIRVKFARTGRCINCDCVVKINTPGIEIDPTTGKQGIDTTGGDQ
jgi:hypothetical protein